jgi:hypothetical protein
MRNLEPGDKPGVYGSLTVFSIGPIRNALRSTILCICRGFRWAASGSCADFASRSMLPLENVNSFPGIGRPGPLISHQALSSRAFIASSTSSSTIKRVPFRMRLQRVSMCALEEEPVVSQLCNRGGRMHCVKLVNSIDPLFANLPKATKSIKPRYLRRSRVPTVIASRCSHLVPSHEIGAFASCVLARET